MNQQGRIHDYFKFNEIKTNLDPGRKFFTNSYGLVCVLTFFWLSLGSFKTGAQLNNPALLLFKPTLENWKEVLRSGVLESAYRSATVGLVTVSLSVVIGSMGAYAISRYKTGGSSTRFGILAAQVLPPAVLVFRF